jgi:hypothetical protein
MKAAPKKSDPKKISKKPAIKILPNEKIKKPIPKKVSAIKSY